MSPAIGPELPKAPVALLPEVAPGALHLWLREPGCFFLAPEVDPMAGCHVELSGFDLVLNALKRRTLAEGTLRQVVLHIPAAMVESDTEARLAIALSDHVAARIAAEQDDIFLIEKELRRAWRAGILFLAICVVLEVTINSLPRLNEFWREILTGSVVIAGWVGLWRPLELTLYDRWAPRLRKKTLAQLGDVRLRVQPVSPVRG